MATLLQSYADVLARAEELGVTLTRKEERDGKLWLEGQAAYAWDADRVWDQIKTHPSWANETGIQIHVKNSEPYGLWKVKSGDSLSKIAQQVYQDMKRYPEIFEANRDQLKDPDKVQVGQTLKLPPKVRKTA
jgi:di/tripeptidase